MSPVDDTIVQVRNEAGEWVDYARTDRASALSALEAKTLPGHAKPEELRAVDWITREEITMTTRTATARARTKAADTKARSDANGKAEEEAREAINEIVDDAAKAQEAPKPKPRRTRAAVTTKRVRPTEPDYDKLPEGKREAARRTYEAALARFEKATGLPVDKETGAKLAAAAKKAPADTKAKATKKPGVPARTLGRAPADTNGFDWKDAKLPGRVLKLKASGKTIKQITAELGLPAREGVWHKVSLIYRAAADAKGIERQRRNGTK